VGSTAIWVGSEDGRVYAVAPDGSAILRTGCVSNSAIRSTPALSNEATQVAFGATVAGRLYAVDTGTLCAGTLLADPFLASPALNRAGKVFVASSVTGVLRMYTFDGTGIGETWQATVGSRVGAPVAIDAAEAVWSGSEDKRLSVTTSSGVTSPVQTLGGAVIDSPVVLAGGDVVVGDDVRVLHRFAPDGTQIWASEPLLDGAVLAPLVLAGGDATLVVPTRAGSVYGVGADGAIIWSATLTTGQELRAGNIHTPPGSPSSTAYFGSADGNLYAVVVDGGLDTSAPWPKAHHDVRNTGNAGSPLP